LVEPARRPAAREPDWAHRRAGCGHGAYLVTVGAAALAAIAIAAVLRAVVAVIRPRRGWRALGPPKVMKDDALPAGAVPAGRVGQGV
jgi:hypothetical protein